MNENKQIVEQGYQHFGSGNIDGLIALFDENIKWTIPEVKGSPMPAVTNGRENVRDFFRSLGEAEEFTSFEPKEFISEGNKVVVLGRSAGKVTSTARSFDVDWVHIFNIENSKITSFLEYFDNAAMERAYQKAESA